MGFMDKAKKLADQAQTKLDEVQKQFNESQGTGSGSNPQGPAGGPAIEYDQHGRPIAQPADGAHTTATPQQGDPIAGVPAPPPAPTSPQALPGDPEPPHGDPLLTGEDASRHGADADRGERPVTPPPAPSSGSGLSSGDPLAG